MFLGMCLACIIWYVCNISAKNTTVRTIGNVLERAFDGLTCGSKKKPFYNECQMKTENSCLGSWFNM